MKFSAIIFVTAMLSVVHARFLKGTNSDAVDPTESITADDRDMFQSGIQRRLPPQHHPRNINVMRLEGNDTIQIRVDSNETVSDVKDKIENEAGIPREVQVLTFAGCEEFDNCNKLDDDYDMMKLYRLYNIEKKKKKLFDFTLICFENKGWKGHKILAC